ncbi:uncharacterized protein LOC127714432 [Mytilus californianus]|uniref:uncharacterized protein LOC127714432 n=1 Tax=Mytilus californianus TaxID=6549 RepID=UPI0022459D16|nr:uncharacterized protein LOC127714432 [Mytilus californianus]
MKLVWCVLVLCILSTSYGTALPEEDDLESINDIDESELGETYHKRAALLDEDDLESINDIDEKELGETDQKRTALTDEDDLDEINDIDERDLEENDHKIEKRWGKVRLTKIVLKKLAKELRRNGSVARRAVKRLESWTGGRLSANKITNVIEGVADRLNRYETATCNFFAGVAARLRIPRWIGYKICQLAIYLLL